MGFFVCLRVTCSFSRFVHVNPMCFDPDDFVVWIDVSLSGSPPIQTLRFLSCNLTGPHDFCRRLLFIFPLFFKENDSEVSITTFSTWLWTRHQQEITPSPSPLPVSLGFVTSCVCAPLPWSVLPPADSSVTVFHKVKRSKPVLYSNQ